MTTRGYQKSNAERKAESFELANASTTQLTSRMNEEFNMLKTLADNIVHDWANNQIEQSELVTRLRADLQRFPQIHSAGIAFDPRKYLARIDTLCTILCQR